MFEKMKAAFRRSQARYAALRDYRVLQSMDENLLRDIGITRGDADHALARPRFRP